MTVQAIETAADVEGLPRPSRPAILLHTTSRFGYGHAVRCARIATEVVRRLPCDAYISAPRSGLIAPGPAGVHHLVLPAAVPADGSRQPGAALAGDADDDATAVPDRRSRLLAGLARHLRPAAVLVDQFPMSVIRNVAECVEMLAMLGREAPGVVRCAGFRGVHRLQISAEEEQAIIRLLEEYVDLVVVHVDARERESLLRQHRFLAALAPRLRFTGYVAPSPAPGPAEPRRALATFGCGVDAHAKLRLVCDGFLAFAARHPGWRLDVVTGDRLPPAALADIEARYAREESVRVARFVPGLAGRLGRYALVLSMGGYATCVELYQASTRSIVLPRREPDDTEQVGQARKFEGYGAIDRVLDAGATTPADLASVIEEVLASPPRPRAAVDMAGAGATADLLVEAMKP